MKLYSRFLLPLLIAVLVFSFTLFTGCTKARTQTTTVNTALTSSYIKGFLDGEEITMQTNASYFTNVSNQNGEGYDEHNEGEDNDKSTVVTGATFSDTTAMGIRPSHGTIELRKEVFRIYVTPFMNSVYYGMVVQGIYNFAYTNGSHKGAYISIRDKNNVLWTSKGDQNNSSFMITERGTNKQMFSTVSGTFTCNLYNSQGSMKPFTNGTFTANFGL